MSIVSEPERLLLKFKQMPERDLGRFGERVCQNILLASGIYYSPLKDISNGGAPMAISANGKIVLPDFDCACEAWIAFIDAKCKRRPILFRNAKQIRHGIDKRNYDAYRNASNVYKKQAGIMVIELFDKDKEEWSGRILVESFRGLGEPLPGLVGTWGERMVFWTEKMFVELDRLSVVELVEAFQGRCDSYRGILDRVFDRRIQGNLFP